MHAQRQQTEGIVTALNPKNHKALQRSQQHLGHDVGGDAARRQRQGPPVGRQQGQVDPCAPIVDPRATRRVPAREGALPAARHSSIL